MADYGALIRGPAAYAGVDQGIDFTGPGTVLALGTAQVTRLVRSGSGWPGEGAVLVYKLLDGPGKGNYVYVAEDFAPAPNLHIGAVVPKGQPLGQATGSGKAPGIEVGWATKAGLPVAPRPPARPADQTTPQGKSFQGFVYGLSGSSAGTDSSVGAFLTSPVTQLPADLQAGISHVPGVVQAESISKFLGRLVDPSYLLRGLQIIAGGTLLLAGLFLLARQVALAADLPTPPNPIKKIDRAAEEAGSGPVGERSPRQQRAVGFEPSDAEVRRKPKRGAPGSTQLAKGDTIPYA